MTEPNHQQRFDLAQGITQAYIQYCESPLLVPGDEKFLIYETKSSFDHTFNSIAQKLNEGRAGSLPLLVGSFDSSTSSSRTALNNLVGAIRAAKSDKFNDIQKIWHDFEFQSLVNSELVKAIGSRPRRQE